MIAARDEPAGRQSDDAARARLRGIVTDPDRPDPDQMRILARLAPETKLAVARRLRDDALALKEAWLRIRHPDEDDATIRRRLRAWQLHGRARLD